MKLSVSIELVRQLATEEAIAADFKEIEPEHLLESLLKLAELSVEDVARIGSGGNVAKDLAVEVAALRKTCQRRGIDTTVVRRRVREELGKGNWPHKGEFVHRSQASRDAFDAAAKRADTAHCETVTAEHLLETLLAAPTPPVIRALGGQLPCVAPQPSNTPLLDAHGVDLTRMAAEGRLPLRPGREVETKMLLQHLAEGKGGAIVIISDYAVTGRWVVSSAAYAIAHDQAPQDLCGRRIVVFGMKSTPTADLSESELLALLGVIPVQKMSDEPEEIASGVVDDMEKHFDDFAREAAPARVILVDPARYPERLCSSDVRERRLAAMRRVVHTEDLSSILCLRKEEYDYFERKEKSWLRQVQPLWIAEAPLTAIPDSL